MRLGLAAAAVIGIAAAVITVVALRSHNNEVPLDPDLVAVATLTNETGDAALAPLGRMAAEWLTRGIQQRGVAEVVPPSVALAAAEEVRNATDPVAAFAQATSAGVVLHGAYYLMGDSLQFQLQISDVVEGKLMTALAPVTAPSEPATEALDLLRERVLGTLAAALDLRSGALHLPMQPRTLELYRVFRQGVDATRRFAAAEALQRYRQAWAMDSTFYPALVMVTAWVQQRVRYAGQASLQAEADSLMRLAEGYRDRMSEAERLFLQLRQAREPEAGLRTVRRLAELAPFWTFFVGHRAWTAYRPREALEYLTGVDAAKPDAQTADWWRTTAQAHHMLHNYEEELEFARAVRRQRPDDLLLMDGHLRPLAALGRMEELTALLDTAFALPVERGPTGLITVPHLRSFRVADELRAHGHRDAGRRVLQRTIEWIQARPPEEVRQEGWAWLAFAYRYSLAVGLYKLGHWEEARAVYEELLAEGWSGDTLALAGLGAIAARQGNVERAQAISEQLAERPGGQPLGRAHIAALLGEREEAVRLLREALRHDGPRGINSDWGTFMLRRHQDTDLEPLRDYPPFELFLRPRG
jgi:tetratricopeptide (TPR) repeat protein